MVGNKDIKDMVLLITKYMVEQGSSLLNDGASNWSRGSYMSSHSLRWDVCGKNKRIENIDDVKLNTTSVRESSVNDMTNNYRVCEPSVHSSKDLKWTITLVLVLLANSHTHSREISGNKHYTESHMDINDKTCNVSNKSILGNCHNHPDLILTVEMINQLYDSIMVSDKNYAN